MDVTYHDYCGFPIIDHITTHYELSTIYICIVEDTAEGRKTSIVALDLL